MTMIADRLPVIDTDAHISEPGDLWTSRLPEKYQAIAPRIVRMDSIDDPEADEQDIWVIGEDRKFFSGWEMSWAGWKDYWPKHPPIKELVDPACYDAKARAERLDEFGIRAQALYPNILAFYLPVLLATGDPEFHLSVVRAYNDFLIDFAAEAPGRFIPMMMPPLWDREASVKEIERCAGNGHKGIVFGPEPEKMGWPRLRDPHWDAIFAVCQEAGLPVNFHAGVASLPDWAVDAMGPGGSFKKNMEENRSDLVKMSALSFLGNATPIAEVVCSGICERFPSLNFVSIESGFGYVPYLLNLCDWQFLGYGSRAMHPDWLLPSEYFRRQVHCTFWFESETVVRLADLYPDNLMFETDFPHPTCMAPGPVSITERPKDVIEANLKALPESLLRKILFENAARLYKLDV